MDDGLKPKLRWRVARVVDSVRETDSARTIGLAVPGWGGHLPGQHIDLKLTAEDGYSAQRSYSLSRPADGERIELTVQQIADGEVSPYLTAVRPGEEIELRGPIGGWFVWRPATCALCCTRPTRSSQRTRSPSSQSGVKAQTRWETVRPD